MKISFDSALESALENEFSWLDNFENPYADYQFSSRFETNMQHIISKSQHRYISIGKSRVRKLFVAALVALLAVAITGCAFAVHYII